MVNLGLGLRADGVQKLRGRDQGRVHQNKIRVGHAQKAKDRFQVRREVVHPLESATGVIIPAKGCKAGHALAGQKPAKAGLIRDIGDPAAHDMVMDALMMAVWRRGKADALLHHSDQGSQYTSEQFQRLLADNGITCSMSRAGNVWDNSAMESFFSSLKTERTARKVYRTRDEARADVFDYIERFYNPRRRHSKLGYLSPMEFEARAMLA